MHAWKNLQADQAWQDAVQIQWSVGGLTIRAQKHRLDQARVQRGLQQAAGRSRQGQEGTARRQGRQGRPAGQAGEVGQEGEVGQARGGRAGRGGR